MRKLGSAFFNCVFIYVYLYIFSANLTITAKRIGCFSQCKLLSKASLWLNRNSGHFVGSEFDVLQNVFLRYL